MFVGTPKERFSYHNTLLCLVKALQGQAITVDLRNDSYVCGVITSVDGFMNLSFNNAVFCDAQGNEFLFENLFVQSRNIRYVHVPERLSILGSIKSELNRNKRQPINTKPETSRKARKALKQHMETVASLNI